MLRVHKDYNFCNPRLYVDLSVLSVEMNPNDPRPGRI